MSEELAAMLGRRFIERRDVKAIQHPNGMWTPDMEHHGHGRGESCGEACIPKKWSMADLRAHVAGERTYGHYLIGTDNTCKLFAFDLDLVKEGYFISLKEDEIMQGGQPCNPREIWQDESHPGREWLVSQLRCLAEALALKIVRTFDGDIPVAIGYSGGKGLHVYGFTGSVPAAEARGAAVEVLNAFNCFEPSKGENFYKHQFGLYRNIEIEVFPKQDSLEGKKLGNLMALPLGIHRKTGKKKFFLDCRVGYTTIQEFDAATALEGEVPPWGGAYTDTI